MRSWMREHPFLMLCIVAFAFLLSGCITNNMEEFEIHEWGIFLQDYQNQTTLSLAKSPETVYVKKPVIYFHMVKEENIIVNIKNVTIEEMVPEGEPSEEGINWDIKVKNDKILLADGTVYPYLLYEGMVEIDPPVLASVTYEHGIPTLHVKNLENFPLSDVIFVYIDYGSYTTMQDDFVKVVYFTKIEVNESQENGEEIDVETAQSIIYNRCLQMGLEITEADDLMSQWKNYWFSPSNFGVHTRIIFFIPQDVYDDIIPLSISPEPNRIVRVGIFTIINVPVINRPCFQNLSVAVNVSKKNLSVGETLNITVLVENKGNDSITLAFPTAQKGDISIVDSSNDMEVYRWSEGRYFAQVITQLSIDPGSKLTLLTAEWKPSKKGEYIIRAWTETNPRVFSEPVTIKVN